MLRKMARIEFTYANNASYNINKTHVQNSCNVMIFKVMIHAVSKTIVYVVIISFKRAYIVTWE